MPYENVDPKARAGNVYPLWRLVNHEYHSNAPFFVANQQLLEEVGYIQHKGRRVDLIEDEEWLYQFYDQKLPRRSSTALPWINGVKPPNAKIPNILFLTKADLTREQDEQIE